MKKKKETRGGKRPGAGRKFLPEGEKKIQIIRYYKKNDVEKLGGKVIVNQLLDEEFKNKLKIID